MVTEYFKHSHKRNSQYYARYAPNYVANNKRYDCEQRVDFYLWSEYERFEYPTLNQLYNAISYHNATKHSWTPTIYGSY